uniref:Promethin n=1 Tax=Panagrolaimus sp. JU765 TaxID=591449 RepID=A0AC34QEU6_9BILA
METHHELLKNRGSVHSLGTKFDNNLDQKPNIKMEKQKLYGFSSDDQAKILKIILIGTNIFPLFFLFAFTFLVLVTLIYWFILISVTLIGSGILFTIPFILMFTLFGLSIAAVFLVTTSFISRDTLTTYFSLLDQINI